jgi:hypothetical protein
MDLLYKASGDKNSIDKILSLCERKLNISGQIGRKEFRFTACRASGKFQTYYPIPGLKEFAMFFEEVTEEQLEQIEVLGLELLGNTEHSTVEIIKTRPVDRSYVTNVISKTFIDSLCLNIRNNSGINIRSGKKELGILGGLNGIYLLVVKNFCKLNEKSLLQLNNEAESVIREVLLLKAISNNRARSKKIPMLLKEDDMGWHSVLGTKCGGTTSYIEKNNIKHYLAEASAGFKFLNGNISNLFSDTFINTVRSMDAIDMLKLIKDNGTKRYVISTGTGNNDVPKGSTTVNVTVERSLGTEKMYGEEVRPETIRIANVIHDLLTENIDLKKAFIEYILNYTNQTCVCGENLATSLNKNISEIGCYSEQKHLIHTSCWPEWKKKNKPQKYNWNESFCPFCGADCSVYNTPWQNGKLVWKTI